MLDRRCFITSSALAALGIATVGASTGCSSQAEKSQDQKAAETAAPQSHKVTDLDGNSVELPASPNAIAALAYPSYSRLLYMGEEGRAVISSKFTPNDWTLKIYPHLKEQRAKFLEYKDARKPNLEELVQLKCDLVYYWAQSPDMVKQMQDLGLTVLATYPKGEDFKNIEDWKTTINTETQLYADSVNSQEGKERVAAWQAYLEQVLTRLNEKLADLSDDERKTVYYMREKPDGTEAFSYKSYVRIAVEAAGGRLVNAKPEDEKGYLTYTMEEILGFDPEYIFVGWLPSIDPFTGDDRWNGMRAIKDHKIFVMPYSINNSWPHDFEMPLAMLYLAKRLHPDRFKDLNLTAEVVDFYKKFRKVEISEEDAICMLNRQSPGGSTQWLEKL